ncbi:MAG: hypothetical protein O3A25_14745 [Acidobacteria bacterium]|nr:hypothetical protein [Acidobacteriota bacterium]
MILTAPAPRAALTGLTRLTGPIALGLVLWASTVAQAQPVPNVHFRHLTVDDGLSYEGVHSVLQDSRGLLWIGTADGLNRYDGYDITVFNRDPRNPNALANSWIWSIAEDSRGNIWVGTDGGGLHRFLPEQNAFERFVTDPSDPTSLSHDTIRVLFEDHQGVLWIGTDGGLNSFDDATGTFTRFAHNPSNPGSLSDDAIRAIEEDSNGTLWIGTVRGGINLFDRDTGTFTHLRHDLNRTGFVGGLIP